MSVEFRCDLSALDHMLDGLADNVEGAVRPAAQAAAQVLYDNVKVNVGRKRRYTGNLDASIYQAYSASNSTPLKAVYHVSWNHKKAPHGHLVECGHLMYYIVYKDNSGNLRTLVRPGMDGKPPPSKRASRAEKDAYYVPLPGGPRQIPASPFIRPAMSKFGQAAAAAEARLLAGIGSKR